MQKILFIITKGDNIGGAQIYVLELAKRFKQDGFDVSVIAGTKGYLTNKLIEEQIEVVHIDSLKMQINLWFDIISIFKIYKYLKKNKPNIVSLNSSKVGIVGRIACFFSKIPCVFTVHGWSFTDGVSPKKQVLFRGIERCLKPLCTGWITVSQYDFNLGIKSKVAIVNKTTLIHNGVIIKNQIAPQKEIFEETQKIKIVFTARHDYQKDHLTLFKAIQNIDNIILYLLGDGPLMEQNKQKAIKPKSTTTVGLAGFCGF
jgi:glycosyltransferase involved in cell wall biosynthesis